MAAPAFCPCQLAVAAGFGRAVFGPVGGVFVIGVGMLALGVPLMVACAVRFRAYLRGETLNEDTPILVPDTGAEPVALSE